MLPSQQELSLRQGYSFNISISFPNFTLLRQDFPQPLACSPSPPPFIARAACLDPSTLCSLPGEPSWTLCHPQQTRALLFLFCSECPFMAHPASCFLLCSCAPYLRLSVHPALLVRFLLTPCPSRQEHRGANIHNQPCSHGSPSPCTSFSLALTLPPDNAALTIGALGPHSILQSARCPSLAFLLLPAHSARWICASPGSQQN